MIKRMILLPMLLLAMMAQSESVVRVVVTTESASEFAADKVRKLVLSPTTVDIVDIEGIVLQSVPVAEMLRVEFGEGTPSVPTGIASVINTPSPVALKVIENGQLFIIRDGKVYNAQGQVVRN